MVSALEGSRAETKTMLPVIEKFMTAHALPDVLDRVSGPLAGKYFGRTAGIADVQLTAPHRSPEAR